MRGEGGENRSVRSPNRKPRWRAARRRELRDRGIQPQSHRWAYSVRPEALGSIPTWARRSAIRGLGQYDGRVWLWRRDARLLMIEDRQHGGQPDVIRVEVKRCDVCYRPLVGRDAVERRRLNESAPGGCRLPCGLSCERDRASKVWRKLEVAH